MSDDLVAFLRARLVEDEQYARSTMWDGSVNSPTWSLTASATVDTGGDEFYAGDRTVANHIERHDPARVLREVEAKRRILQWHTGAHECSGPDDNCMWILDGEACPTTRALALPYADHEDYKEGWKL
ncbi:DUF6221 family protein [Sphaerisporangium sp. TRM90804]|uniref:DUF6221 family protein n=1 Tax=Sphaerisporangium sp. TRM90804 TaxID=3031113 RepID=UPI00244A7F91|nr:DUF6221 family protein [Sphaerisporangium sp. TRM90804]MDH2424760.1 DUF6221 family protein [Sphaerisporangium sp. TRM90804]